MTNIKFILFFLIFSFIARSQSIELEFTPEYSREISKMWRADPEIFVIKETYIANEIVVEISNPEYIAAIEKLNLLKIDSISEIKFIAEYDRYMEMVKTFNSSDERYNKKKHLLIDAQNFFDENGFSYLVYADDNINSKNKSKFNVWKSNETQFKYKLRNEIGKISMHAPKNKSDNLLKQHKAKLARIKPILSRIELDTLTSRKAFILSDTVGNVANLSGRYKQFGKYYIEQRGKYLGDGGVVIEIIEGASGDGIVIQNIESGDLFATSSKIFDYAIDPKIAGFIKILSDKGIKTSQKGSDIIMHMPNANLIMTRDIQKALEKNNFEYINQFANSVHKYKAYANSNIVLNRLHDLRKEYASKYIGGSLTQSFITSYRNNVQSYRNEFDKISNLPFRKDNLVNFHQHLTLQDIERFIVITNALLLAESKIKTN